MSDCKIYLKCGVKDSGKQRNLDVNRGELLLMCYVQRKTTVSFIERWARLKNMQTLKFSILSDYYKNLKLEGRTGTLHVCWQWSLIAEWTEAYKRASARRLLPLCSGISEPSARWVEPTYLFWHAEHSYWYTTDDRDTRGRESLNLKRDSIVKLIFWCETLNELRWSTLCTIINTMTDTKL